jgi:uncharacterized protein
MVSGLVSALLLALPAATPAERAVAIPAGGGVTLTGTLTLPAGPGPHPAAVLVGGFGPTSRDGSVGRRRAPYADLAAQLARRGVAVLRYDKRGIGGSDGPALSWLDARPLTRDAAAAARGLAAVPGMERGRISLIGHSQGGAIALAAARSPAIRVVTLGAPGRPLGLLPRVSGTARRLLTRLAGPGVARATLSTDPRAAAARAAGPALLVHGTRDPTVPVSDLTRLAAARRRAGLPTRALRVRGADHYLQVEGRVPAAAIRQIAAFVS